jgi:RimJ/RimL family protein N-acetyltransferase
MNLRDKLEGIPQVTSVQKVDIRGSIIKSISLVMGSIGSVEIRRLDISDANKLFNFYDAGLSEKSKRLFASYPLFRTAPSSSTELLHRMAEWAEEDNWFGEVLIKRRMIIGFCFLKRIGTEHITSGIAVRDGFMKSGAGYLLQNVMIEQSRLLDVRGFHVKIVSDNLASIRLHEKCGFIMTNRELPLMYEDTLEYLRGCDRRDGVMAEDRRIIEMVIAL